MSYIIYWMESSQRTRYNFALEKAVELSNISNLPLYVINYNLFPKRLKRKELFLEQGFLDIYLNLKKRKINYILLKKSESLKLIEILKKSKYVVTEKNYLKEVISKKNKIIKEFKEKVILIENETTIPVSILSTKEEYNARTLRIKYNKIKDEYLKKFKENIYFKKNSIPDLDKLIKKHRNTEKKLLDGDFLGGENEALKTLDYFIKNNLKDYSKRPMTMDSTSKLSIYLACGQISPLEIALKIKDNNFLEELLIRRELSYNFVNYNKGYNLWGKMTYSWAHETMKVHEKDKREYIYTKKDLENYKTHDLYWNFAQKTIVSTGFLHGYLRMYWCKKIIEWSKTPKEAYTISKYLNNKYFYDGDTPNSYAGIAWCFGKHDRAWKEREVLGKLRYMSTNGLIKKFEKLGD